MSANSHGCNNVFHFKGIVTISGLNPNQGVHVNCKKLHYFLIMLLFMFHKQGTCVDASTRESPYFFFSSDSLAGNSLNVSAI